MARYWLSFDQQSGGHVMSDAPKKVSTKIWRPILEKLEEKMDASCLRRDAYLNRVLAVELDYLDTEVALPNSTEAKKFIAERLDHLADRKLVSLSLRPDLVERLNDLCERKQIVRDAFFNRLFLLLAAAPKTLDRLLFNGESDWRTEVWSEFKNEGPAFQNTFYPLEQEIDPFWALRTGLDIRNDELDLGRLRRPGLHRRDQGHARLSPARFNFPRGSTRRFGATRKSRTPICSVSIAICPTWRIPNHPDELASRQRLDDLLALTLRRRTVQTQHARIRAQQRGLPRLHRSASRSVRERGV
jgi:hypothetical protein